MIINEKVIRKNIIICSILLFIVGCDTRVTDPNYIPLDFELDTQLPMDENGYYHIEWLEGYNQTFATLEAITNTEGYNKIYWTSQQGIEYGGEFVSCVNPASYTSDGVARQTMAVWEEMVGDTITIYSSFEDWCYIQHIDSIKVVVDNEI